MLGGVGKQVLVEPRFDFRAGLNEVVGLNMLNVNELAVAKEARLTEALGAVSRRLGSRRLTSASLGGPVTGLAQWDAPSLGRQIVAIANGQLHHSVAEGTWASAGSGFSTEPSRMETARENAANAPLRLYVSDGQTVRRWTGSSLATISGTNGIPANVDVMAYYGLRLFFHSKDFLQSLFWTVLGDPEDATAGLGDMGGAALVDVRKGQPIVAMEAIGSSLLICSPNATLRFSGYSAADIQIAQDTEGISSEVGAVGPFGLLQVEEVAALLAERDVYVVNEQEIRSVGQKVRPRYQRIDRTRLGQLCMGYNAMRRELYIALPGPLDSGENRTVLCYNTELDSWYGPWHYPFGIRCFSRYEDTNGDEWVLAGCDDGHVRLLDEGHRDDRLTDGSGGVQIGLTQAELAPVFFEVGPHTTKTLRRVNVQLEADADCLVRVGIRFDSQGWQWRRVPGRGLGQVVDHRLDFYAQGKRLYIRVEMEGDGEARLHGLTAEAFNMQRN